MSKRHEIVKTLKRDKPFVYGNSYQIKTQSGDARLSKLVKHQPYESIRVLEEQKHLLPLQECLKSSIFVWINTYNRVKCLQNLLRDICDNQANFKIKVFIVDDFSTDNYTDMLRNFSGKLDIVYHKVSFNHGKKLYWMLCNYTLSKIKLEINNYRYFIKIDDDCRLVKDFFVKCVNIWESIIDRRKICLNFRLDTREGKSVWTGILPKLVTFNNIPLYLSQWVDMDFICDARMFKTLDFQITRQPEERWKYNRIASSGVGRDISVRLVNRGYHLYLTTESLVNHDHHDSKMNPEERGRNPLTTKPITNLGYGLPK
jgi:glycosyltransferase involved in cell wall biosynthesis